MRRAVLAVAVVLAGCAHGSMTAAPASTWISPLWNISGSNAQVTAVANFVAFGEGVTFNPAISAVDPASGNFRWSYSFPGFNQYTFAPQTFVCDVEPDILFAAVAGNYDGAYAAMNRSNGASLWLLPMSVQFVNEAQWLCPKVRGDPLVIVSTTVLYGADAQRGKLLYERYVNTTTSPQTFIVERCGPREATRCVVFQDAQGLHVLDAKTGQDVRRALSPLPFGGYAVASASNLVLLQAGDAVQALYWNGTVAWTAPSGTNYAGGNDKVWVSANNGYATGFSSVTGDVLWNWTNPCGTIHSPLPLNGEECQPQFNFFPVLPVASTYCFQNQGCSSAAFDAVTGEVKWYVANQTLSFVPTGSKDYAVVSNNTDATVFNVATGSQRNVQVHSRVWGVASNDKVVILQNIFTLAFSRF